MVLRESDGTYTSRLCNYAREDVIDTGLLWETTIFTPCELFHAAYKYIYNIYINMAKAVENITSLPGLELK